MFALLQVHLGVCPYLGKVPLCLPHWIILFNLIYFMMKRIDKGSCMSTHERVHTGKNPMNVSNVARVLVDQETLIKSHQRVHKGEKSFECTWCGKCFSIAGHQKRHERVHTGERPFECKHCGKCFQQKGNLRVHERVHTREKPDECKQCGKCFSQPFSFRVHERVHTGEKPYECKQCGKCFSIASNLRRHEKVHTKRNWGTYHSNRRPSQRLLCWRNSGGSRGIDISSGIKNNRLTRRDTRNRSHEVNFLSATVETHSCWICQEEMSSEAFLLQHYENHMRHIEEDEL